MKINNPIQSLWIGDELSVMEQMCIKSYLHHGHQFHLYCYEDIKNIPNGTILKNANEIIDQSSCFIDHFGGHVNFSNKFRFTLLYKKGGWWVDMDTVCLKPFDFTDDYVFSSEFSDPYNRFLVNTTFIKSLPNAKFLEDCLKFIGTRGLEYLHWGELGVNLLSRMIFRNDLRNYIKTPEYFCPISGYKLNLLIDCFDPKLLDGSYALHWWNELWRRRKINKNKEFPESSLYEILKRKYYYNV